MDFLDNLTPGTVTSPLPLAEGCREHTGCSWPLSQRCPEISIRHQQGSKNVCHGSCYDMTLSKNIHRMELNRYFFSIKDDTIFLKFWIFYTFTGDFIFPRLSLVFRYYMVTSTVLWTVLPNADVAMTFEIFPTVWTTGSPTSTWKWDLIITSSSPIRELKYLQLTCREINFPPSSIAVLRSWTKKRNHFYDFPNIF